MKKLVILSFILIAAACGQEVEDPSDGAPNVVSYDEATTPAAPTDIPPAPENATCGCQGSFNFQTRSRNLIPAGVIYPSYYEFRWNNPADLNACAPVNHLQAAGEVTFKLTNGGTVPFMTIPGLNVGAVAFTRTSFNPGQSGTFKVPILECVDAYGPDGGIYFKLWIKATQCPEQAGKVFSHRLEIVSVTGGHVLAPLPVGYGASYSSGYCTP